MIGNWKWLCRFMPVILVAAALTFVTPASAEGEVSLFTPYHSLSAPPGETINYSIDVINNTSSIQTVDLAVESAPDKWEYELTAGGRKIERLSVKPKESQSVNLEVNVPLEVNKGAYQFRLSAKGMSTLTLTINVSEQGTYTTELETKQPNMEGRADSTFTFSTTLKNRTASKQLYALKAEAPQGWDVQFSVDGKNVTSVSLDPNAQQDISITVRPPDQVKKDTYKIPVTASTSTTSAKTELEVVITGTYALELSTPNGNLHADITAGSTRKLTLQVTNKGTAPLNDIEMSASTPANWEVTFEPQKIKTLEPGKSTEVQATVKADKKAIAGDYVLNMTARAPEKTAEAQFRMTVETSVLWGWIGVLIIAAVVGGVYYLFRKYGRR